MSFRVRPSKFRHVYGDPAKKPLCYENIRISKNAHDTYFSCANPKFLAVITESAGGGAFQVLPLEKVGRIDLDWGKATGHSGPVLDIKFNPFNDNVIASASEDCTIKIWHIPDGGSREIRDCLLTLKGHQRRVVQIEWHPIAENILLSAASDTWVIVWDVGRGDTVRVIDCHRDVVCSMGFNWTGNLIATTCRDLQLRLIEPRMANVAQVTPGHAGSKPSKLAFLTNRRKIFTTGFSKYSDRQYAIWDINNLSQPLKMDILDSSSGIVFPYYDPDTAVVYLAGRGDGNIRYYELTDTIPYMHYLSQFQSNAPQRSLCYMPKRGLNFNACEIWRFYKLYATKNYIEPISMIAPRKAGFFHEDLFPDTAAPTSSLTTEEWLNGSNAPPVMISLKNAASSLKTNKPVMYNAAENQLITSDRNNELKFRFIAADASNVDYRPLTERKLNKPNGNHSALEDVENRFPDEYRPKSLHLPSSLDGSNRNDLKEVNGDKWKRFRYSLQEDAVGEKCDQENVHEYCGSSSTPAPAPSTSRSFQKLQRIWSDRQHSIDVAVPDSPAPDSELRGCFPALDECAEYTHGEIDTGAARPMTASAPAPDELAKASGCGVKEENGSLSSCSQDGKNDKENFHIADESFPQMYKSYLEQKETISRLERLLKVKEEENFRLLSELEILRSHSLPVGQPTTTTTMDSCTESADALPEACTTRNVAQVV